MYVDLRVVRITMYTETMSFKDFDNVSSVEDVEKWPENTALRHAKQQRYGAEAGITNMYHLCMTRQKGPDPITTRPRQTKGNSEYVQQNVMIDGVKGCCIIQHHKCSQFAGV